MLKPCITTLRILAGTLLVYSWTASGALVIPGADGSDGAFSPTANTEIDLSQAPTAGWTTPGDGRGVYDPTKWAVVFKYSSVNIPAGVTVTFKNHDSRAAVVWLVSGDVTIAGTLSLKGQNWVSAPARAESGPGGYLGAVGYQSVTSPAGGGLGIGGGLPSSYGGSHATAGYLNTFPTYGNPRVLPLVGGSGGGGDFNGPYGGGGGGGALLLAVSGTLTVDGIISAQGGDGSSYGGSGSGAGGAVRLTAETIAGNGAVYAFGGQATYYGGDGRIRIETLNPAAAWAVVPVATVAAPDNPVLLWLPAGAPTVEVLSVATEAVPPDPRARLDPGREDVSLPILGGAADIQLQTNYVDPLATVQVRITPEFGAPFFVNASFDSGDHEAATWIATATLPSGVFTVQAHAVNPAP